MISAFKTGLKVSKLKGLNVVDVINGRTKGASSAGRKMALRVVNVLG